MLLRFRFISFHLWRSRLSLMDVPGVCHCCHPFCHSVQQWLHVFKFILSTIICKLVRPALKGTCFFTNFFHTTTAAARSFVFIKFRAPWLTSWLWWLGLIDLDYLHNLFCLQRTNLTKLCKINSIYPGDALWSSPIIYKF